MFGFFRRIVRAVFARPGPSDPPLDPYAAVREPRRRRPAGGSSAIALAEPGPDDRVHAVGPQMNRHR